MKKLRITVGNKSYDVTVEDLTETDEFSAATAPMTSPAVSSGPAPTPAPAVSAAARPPLPVDSGAVTSPMAGVIISVLVKEGDSVTQGRALVVLEAMKMENQITAPVSGCVKSVDVATGDSVSEGHILLVLE